MLIEEKIIELLKKYCVDREYLLLINKAMINVFNNKFSGYYNTLDNIAINMKLKK